MTACNCTDIRQIFFSELRRTAPTVIVWATLALALSYYNSWLLQDPTETGGQGHPEFTFPILYTLCQTITQVIAIGCVFMFASDTLVSPSCSHFVEHWPLLLIFAAVRLVQIGGEAWALTETSLSFNESVKSLVPVFVMILSCLFEGRRFGWPLILAVMFLTAGAALVAIGAYTHNATHSTIFGTVLTCLATLAAACTPVIAALLLRHEVLTVLVLTWYEAVLTAPVYVVVWLMTPAEGLSSMEYVREHIGQTSAYLITGSLLALCYSLIGFYLIKITSSLTNVVLGSAKHVLMVVVAAFAVDKISDGTAFVGITLFVPALLLYGFLSLSNLVASNFNCGECADGTANEQGHTGVSDGMRLVGGMLGVMYEPKPMHMVGAMPGSTIDKRTVDETTALKDPT